MNDAILQQCSALLKNRAGLLVQSHQYPDLSKTIQAAMRHFSLTPESFLSHLAFCNEHDPVFEFMITGITVGETYFFRDADQFALLQNDLLPKIIAEKINTDDMLRIWSAGCASGEEIYSIAMLLDFLLPSNTTLKIQLTGTDINTQALKKAQTGIYTEWSLRAIPDIFRHRYFKKINQEYELDEHIKNQVRFSYLNLNDLNYPSILNGVYANDVVLCRNVFIYFAPERIASIIKQLSESLKNNGVLMLGPSDPSYFDMSELQRVQTQHTTYFKKTAHPALAPILEYIHEKEITLPTIELAEKRDELDQLMSNNQWEAALIELTQTQTNNPPSFALQLAEIKTLANLGEIEEALQRCEQLRQENPLSSELYYWLGLCHTEKQDFIAAETLLRKALYLDPSFLAAKIQLAHLMIHQKNHQESVKQFQAILYALNKMPENAIITDYEGMDVARLKQLIEHELVLCQSQQDVAK